MNTCHVPIFIIGSIVNTMPGTISTGKKVLFEAQLGALRDIDFGIYPYTTSSNVIGAYAPIGAGDVYKRQM